MIRVSRTAPTCDPAGDGRLRRGGGLPVPARPARAPPAAAPDASPDGRGVRSAGSRRAIGAPASFSTRRPVRRARPASRSGSTSGPSLRRARSGGSSAKGDARVVVRTGPLEVDERRVALYLRARDGRAGSAAARPSTPRGTRPSSSRAASTASRSATSWRSGWSRVAITDRGQRSLSAVYTYWDPDYAALSLGHLFDPHPARARRRREGLDWVYLGPRDPGKRQPWPTSWASSPTSGASTARWRRFSRGDIAADAD